ncbi:MAG TPA: 50S ribosomal protein L23 [Thermodesulfobacteriota bacterium]|nr:50S ribosomal protein L23 [Thermodesulfobacteriota bacterium]
MRDPRQIIKRPLVTEKSSDSREKNWYVFSVDKRSNKQEIKDAIEKIFKVKVGKVRTLVTTGKKVKRFGRVVGKKQSLKKAYIEIKEGTIEIFEGV